MSQILLRLPDPLAQKLRRSSMYNSNPTQGLTASDLEVRYAHEKDDSNKFYVVFNETELYPALLTNLPCPLETHRTFDSKTIYKSADVGQALVVYMTENEFNEGVGQQQKLDGNYFHYTGLTLPTHNIIQRKYLKTRHFSAFPPDVVKATLEEVIAFSDNKETVEIYEELVDFEEWMLEKPLGSEEIPRGICVTLEYNPADIVAASTSSLVSGGTLVLDGGEAAAASREKLAAVWANKRDAELVHAHPGILRRSLLDKMERMEGLLAPEEDTVPGAGTSAGGGVGEGAEGLDTEGAAEDNAAGVDGAGAGHDNENMIENEEEVEEDDAATLAAFEGAEAAAKAEAEAAAAEEEEEEEEGGEGEYYDDDEGYYDEAEADGDAGEPRYSEANDGDHGDDGDDGAGANVADGGSGSGSDSGDDSDDGWLEELNNRELNS
jgi:hypothetical protein